MASGIYYYQMTAPGFSEKKKMVLLKLRFPGFLKARKWPGPEEKISFGAGRLLNSSASRRTR